MVGQYKVAMLSRSAHKVSSGSYKVFFLATKRRTARWRHVVVPAFCWLPLQVECEGWVRKTVLYTAEIDG